MWRMVKTFAWWFVAPALLALGWLYLRIDRSDRERAERERRASRERDADLVDLALRGQRTQAKAAAEAATHEAEAAEWARKRAEANARILASLPRNEREKALEKIRQKLRDRKPRLPAIVLGIVLTMPGSAKAAVDLTHPTTGVQGWWMDDAEHREVAEWLAELADMREAHAALRRSAAFSAVAVDRAEASAALCMAHVQALEAAIPAIELTRDEALARANAWYRRPAVWLTLGFAGGIAATLAVAL